ncbi:MAG: hypothetical protein M1816_006876 [Peltula sp. TS41687]|nr:MAG: hypothetical protein M1816_006876 [Peltula sp. TS41687]
MSTSTRTSAVNGSSYMAGSPDQQRSAEPMTKAGSPVNGLGGGDGGGGLLSRNSSTYSSSYGMSTAPRSPDPETTITRPLSPVSLIAEGSTTTDGSSPAGGQWSSAVGRATMTGKSGRVIERIQAENDRLRRELRLETLRREEEQKKSELARGQMQSLQSTYDNAAHMRELDLLSLARRERKMQELRADLEGERARRGEAESQLKQLMRESERVEAELKARLREETERAMRATSQYEILASSWRQMDEDYRRKAERLQAELVRLRLDSVEDQKRLDRLEITVEQHRQEVEKMRAVKERLAREFEAYQVETEMSTRGMRERAENNERSNEEALQETMRLLGQMRHVINLTKFVRDTSG